MARRLAGALCVAAAMAATFACAAAASPRPTGRWLAVLKDERIAPSPRALRSLLSRAGVERAGAGAPGLGVVTVDGPLAAIRALRRDRAVRAVSREWARDLRRTPNDPALSTPEADYQVPAGTPIQWALAREDFPGAWDVTTGRDARLAVLDTGVDGSHPELAGKIVTADVAGAADPVTDEDGHGTHVAGLACAATDDGRGIAGAGWGCKLHVIKLGLDPLGGIRDEQIVQGLEIAIARRAHAVNMSFGGGPPNAAVDQAIQTAFDHGIVLVAAASNEADTDQGAPASQLQTGESHEPGAGRGLVVTAADFSDTRAGTGYGPQISIAAYGFYGAGPQSPPGIISTYPGAATPRDVPACRPLTLPTCDRRQLGDGSTYAYLQGTSMATPQVTALAALVGSLNPYLSAAEKIAVIERSARRTSGWSDDLGWGIVDAGAAVRAARLADRLAPLSRVRARRVGRRSVRLRWSGSDPAGAPALVASKIASYRLYARRGHGRWRRIRGARRRGSRVARLRPGAWSFYSRARDRTGNLEAAPARADSRVRIRR